MKKKEVKAGVDILMTVLLLVLMAHKLVGEEVHERCGIAMLLLFTIHQVLNNGWHKNLAKGKYSPVRVLSASLNMLLLLIMLALMGSGIVISRHIFTFLPFFPMQTAARKLHLMASYWGFVLMSVHIGFHGGMILKKIVKEKYISAFIKSNKVIVRCGAISIFVYGIYAFLKRQFVKYMFLQMQYAFFDFGEPLYMFFLDYIFIILAFVIGGYCIFRFFTNKFLLNWKGLSTCFIQTFFKIVKLRNSVIK